MGQLKAKLCNKYPHILQSINFRGLPRAEQYRDQLHFEENHLCRQSMLFGRDACMNVLVS